MGTIWKEVLRPGTYYTPNGVLPVSEEDIDHFCTTGNEMVRAQLEPPIPLEHQDDAYPLSVADRLAKQTVNNAGWTKEFKKHNGSVWAKLDVLDDEIYSKLEKTIKYVSPQISPGFLDGTGKKWDRCITHIALTTRPRFINQIPFDKTISLSSASDNIRLSIEDQTMHPMVEHAANVKEHDFAVGKPSHEGFDLMAVHEPAKIKTILAHPKGSAASPEELQHFHKQMSIYHGAQADKLGIDDEKADPTSLHEARGHSAAGIHHDMMGKALAGRKLNRSVYEESIHPDTPGKEELINSVVPSEQVGKNTNKGGDLSMAEKDKDMTHPMDDKTPPVDPKDEMEEEEEEEEEEEGKGKKPRVPKEQDADTKQAIESLANHGVVIDAEKVKTPKDLVKHLNIILPALHGMLEKSGGAGAAPMPEKKEEAPMAMNMSLEDQLKKLTEENEALKKADLAKQAKLADIQLSLQISTLDSLVAEGQMPKVEADVFKTKLGTHKLSLTEDNTANVEAREILAQMAYAKKLPKGTFWTKEQRLSHGGKQEAGRGLEQSWSTEENTKERAEQVAKQQLESVGLKWR